MASLQSQVSHPKPNLTKGTHSASVRLWDPPPDAGVYVTSGVATNGLGGAMHRGLHAQGALGPLPPSKKNLR
ncbi:hypothetical protein TNCV_923751 [Trichonephila clavipes]|nr:hypothetical protein TNCV_923751 [Trichonephila clavipes]